MTTRGECRVVAKSSGQVETVEGKKKMECGEKGRGRGDGRSYIK